jgi:two-component system response regulator NreC
MRNRTVRVLIVDDHALVREGLKRLIEEQKDMYVVAEASNGPEALEFAASHGPDVALLDISMPGWDGASLARELTRAHPRIRIVAVTRHDDPAFVKRMLEAGAIGYILKQSPVGELCNAIRTVADGRKYIDSALTPASAPPRPGETVARARQESKVLTTEETDVLRLIASSRSLQRIADESGMAVHTVMSLRSSGMQKAGLATRMDIINYARSQGWLS